MRIVDQPVAALEGSGDKLERIRFRDRLAVLRIPVIRGRDFDEQDGKGPQQKLLSNFPKPATIRIDNF